MASVWNKTGTVVGRLSKADIARLIIDCTDKKLVERLLHWHEVTIKLEDKLGLEISEPYEEEEEEVMGGD